MTGRDLSDYQAQHDSIREEFRKQAPSWGRDRTSAHLEWVVSRLALRPEFEVLDVAAGTGLLSRAIAPHVKHVVAVDITPEMLAQGREDAARDGVSNVRFETGAAEDLPYPDDSFDMVATRFSIHHLVRPGMAIAEMHRVCRAGGSLVVIDIVADEDAAVAARYNGVERTRDTSHIRAYSPSGLRSLVADAGVEVTSYLSLDVEMGVDDWLDFTHTEGERRRTILELLERELGGGEITGMRPVRRDGTLLFLHTWGVVVGRK